MKFENITINNIPSDNDNIDNSYIDYINGKRIFKITNLY